jgi:hypothetical protein
MASSTIHLTQGFPATGIRHFGITLENGNKRSPFPPAKTKTLILSSKIRNPFANNIPFGQEYNAGEER